MTTDPRDACSSGRSSCLSERGHAPPPTHARDMRDMCVAHTCVSMAGAVRLVASVSFQSASDSVDKRPRRCTAALQTSKSQPGACPGAASDARRDLSRPAGVGVALRFAGGSSTVRSATARSQMSMWSMCVHDSAVLVSTTQRSMPTTVYPCSCQAVPEGGAASELGQPGSNTRRHSAGRTTSNAHTAWPMPPAAPVTTATGIPAACIRKRQRVVGPGGRDRSALP
jgi:hypothetical protein